MFNFDVNGLVDQIKPAIAKVAESLGTSGEKLLEVGIKGMIAQGIFYAIGSLVSVVILIVCILLFRNGWERSKKSYSDGDGFMMFGVMMGIAALIAFMLFTYAACVHLIAPDFALLMKVKSTLQGY